MVSFWLLVFLVFLVATPVLGFQNETTIEALKQTIQAGEFPAAITMAKTLPPDQSNKWLGEIAAKQFKSGAAKAAISTTRTISSDSIRTLTLGQFFGGNGRGADQSNGGDNSLPSGPGASNPPRRPGNRGGITEADFDPLIELIQSTIDPDGWDSTNGDGTIQPYLAGVYVDSTGLLKRVKEKKSSALARLRRDAFQDTGNRSASVTSPLRKISLNRLEREAQLRAAMGLDPDEEMNNLAGITEVKYLMFFPETNDIVIAGPAGPWKQGAEKRIVSAANGQPVLQLDDLVVCLRNAFYNGGKFGCSIDPRQQNLAATKEFVANSKLTGNAWRKELRHALGRQDVKVFGIDRRTHAGRVIVEADYRMKLVAMGLEPTIPSIPSYLQRVNLAADGSLPPMDVVRWWFTMNYDDIVSDANRQSFQFTGTGVKVLSENEMVDDIGQRIHTGKSAEPTRGFAKDFTEHFTEIAKEYPVYRQLKNVFDLALVASIIRQQDISRAADWNLTYFGKPSETNSNVYRLKMANAVREVDSVVNHRVVTERKESKTLRHTIVGVSGGVNFDARKLITSQGIDVDESGALKSDLDNSQPGHLGETHWWWD